MLGLGIGPAPGLGPVLGLGSGLGFGLASGQADLLRRIDRPGWVAAHATCGHLLRVRVGVRVGVRVSSA